MKSKSPAKVSTLLNSRKSNTKSRADVSANQIQQDPKESLDFYIDSKLLMNREERKEQSRKDQTHYYGVGSLGKGFVRKSHSREVLRDTYKQKYLPSYPANQNKS